MEALGAWVEVGEPGPWVASGQTAPEGAPASPGWSWRAGSAVWPRVEGPQLAEDPSLGWGTAPVGAQRAHTTQAESREKAPWPESLELLSRAATAPGMGRPNLTKGGDWAPLIPSLARASSLGLFFFRKLWGGFLREGKGQGSAGFPPGEWAVPPGPGPTWMAARARARGLGGSGTCG